MRPDPIGLFVAVLVSSFAPPAATAQVWITEIMPSNQRTLPDEDGGYYDWIELHNPTTEIINLGHWSLTDNPVDPARWIFPEVELAPNGYLVVFASEKDRRLAGRPLHTNFRLSQAGEYLALTRPDGTLAFSFGTGFPAVETDMTFGMGMDTGFTHFVLAGDQARYRIPLDASVDSAWSDPEYLLDTNWLSGATGLGAELRPGTYAPFIRTAVSRQSTSLYLRLEFSVAELGTVDGLVLRMLFDDGFAAYLNGALIASNNVPETLAWNSRAVRDRSKDDGIRPRDFLLGAERLRLGRNVLAVHALNVSATRSDYLIVPELMAFRGRIEPEAPLGVLARPTPGVPNTQLASMAFERPEFSHDAGLFAAPFLLRITAMDPEAVIRYTVDGSIPTERSLLYTGPLTISETRQIRARLFFADKPASEPVSRTYVRAQTNVLNFSSNLPILVIDNFGRGAVQTTLQPAFLAVYEPVNGRNVLTNGPQLSTRAAVKIRGSSTQNVDKKSFGIETRGEHDEDRDLPVLGMPAESDWILYAPYNFDRALVRNPFMYELSNQIGRYAVRTRLVELYVHTSTAPLSAGDYAGVYVFMEKIKRGRNRVDVENLLPEQDREPEITGGYMFKIDRLDPGDSGFSSGGQTMAYVDPKEEEITPVQASWIKKYTDAFAAAAASRSYTNVQTGYPAYIDVDSWIDHHILNEFSKNPDGLRLSTYLHKRRLGKLEMGPIWDFDRTLGPDDDNRAADPTGWSGVFSYGWWSLLFRDPDFWQRYGDRWYELRQSSMSVSNLHTIIDSMTVQLEEAQVRNFQRWPLLPAGGWRVEVQQLKDWVSRRVAWIDSQFLSPPVLSRPGGLLSGGETIDFSTTNRSATILYTTDGSDPRGIGGAATATAVEIRSGDPVVLTRTAEVLARLRLAPGRLGTPPRWSALVRALFVGEEIPRLVVTELMYHPTRPPLGSLFAQEDFEFVEISNMGRADANLMGMRFSSAIEFVFSSVQLRPGECVIIAKEPEAYYERYGRQGPLVLGPYQGQLDNGGEQLDLHDPLDRLVLSCVYNDSSSWPDADGTGRSLEYTGWGVDYWRSSNWRASPIGGTPGTTAAALLRVQIRVQGGSVFLTVPQVAGQGVSIEFKDGPVGDWKRMAGATNALLPGAAEVRDPAPAMQPQRTYRLRAPY